MKKSIAAFLLSLSCVLTSLFGQTVDLLPDQISYLGPNGINALNDAEDALFMESPGNGVQCTVLDVNWFSEHEAVKRPIENAVAGFSREYDLMPNLPVYGSGHATQVSAILVGDRYRYDLAGDIEEDSGGGLVGVAPRVNFLPIDVEHRTGLYPTDAETLPLLADIESDSVLNASISFTTDGLYDLQLRAPTFVERLVVEKNTVACVAVGNGARNQDVVEFEMPDYLLNAILVGGSQPHFIGGPARRIWQEYDPISGNVIGGSNYGSRVDIFAPSKNVFTAAFGGSAIYAGIANDAGTTYGPLSGTSYATPMVSGAVASLQSYAINDPSNHARALTPLELKSLIISTGVPQSKVFAITNDYYDNIGRGLDLRAAVNKLNMFLQDGDQSHFGGFSKITQVNVSNSQGDTTTSGNVGEVFDISVNVKRFGHADMANGSLNLATLIGDDNYITVTQGANTEVSQSVGDVTPYDFQIAVNNDMEFPDGINTLTIPICVILHDSNDYKENAFNFNLYVSRYDVNYSVQTVNTTVGRLIGSTGVPGNTFDAEVTCVNEGSASFQGEVSVSSLSPWLTVTSDSYNVDLSSNGEQQYTFGMEVLEMVLIEPVTATYKVILADDSGKVVKESYHDLILLPNDSESPSPVAPPIGRTERDPNRVHDDPVVIDPEDTNHWVVTGADVRHGLHVGLGVVLWFAAWEAKAVEEAAALAVAGGALVFDGGQGIVQDHYNPNAIQYNKRRLNEEEAAADDDGEVGADFTSNADYVLNAGETVMLYGRLANFDEVTAIEGASVSLTLPAGITILDDTMLHDIVVDPDTYQYFYVLCSTSPTMAAGEYMATFSYDGVDMDIILDVHAAQAPYSNISDSMMTFSGHSSLVTGAGVAESVFKNKFKAAWNNFHNGEYLEEINKYDNVDAWYDLTLREDYVSWNEWPEGAAGAVTSSNPIKVVFEDRTDDERSFAVNASTRTVTISRGLLQAALDAETSSNNRVASAGEGQLYRLAQNVLGRLLGDAHMRYRLNGGLSVTVGSGSGNDYVTDGVADQVQIQAACDEVIAAGGGTVTLAGQTFTVDAMVLVAGDFVRLMGAANGSTTIKVANNMTNAAFTPNNLAGILRIKGYNGSSVDTARVSHVHVENITINGNRNGAGTTDRSPDFKKDKRFGIYAEGDFISFYKVGTINCPGYGYDPHDWRDYKETFHMVIDNGFAYGNGFDGMALDSLSYSMVLNSESYENDRHGFNVITNAVNTLLWGLSSWDNGYSTTKEVLSYDSSNGAISYGEDAVTKGHGIAVQNLAHTIYILNSVCFNNSGDGIFVRAADGSVVKNCNTNGNFYHGIRLWGSSHCEVSDNVSINNSQHPLAQSEEIGLDYWYDPGNSYTYREGPEAIHGGGASYNGADFASSYNLVTRNRVTIDRGTRGAYGIGDTTQHLDPELDPLTTNLSGLRLNMGNIFTNNEITVEGPAVMSALTTQGVKTDSNKVAADTGIVISGNTFTLSDFTGGVLTYRASNDGTLSTTDPVTGEVYSVSEAASGILKKAISFTRDGDTLYVNDGVYTGIGNRNLNLNGKAISLLGNLALGHDYPYLSTATNGAPILDCQGKGQGFIFYEKDGVAVAGPDTVVRGFVIRNGEATDSIGGAMKVTDSSPTIANMIFDNCSAAKGGGIYISNSNMELKNVAMYNCTATSATGASVGGGGMYVSASPAAMLFDKIHLEGCSSFNGGKGGGIYLTGNTPTITFTLPTIKQCSAYDEASGGGIFSYQSNLRLTSPSIEDCSSNNGGAIYAKEGSLIINEPDEGRLNIYGCKAFVDGGGIFSYQQESLTLNNINVYDCGAGRNGGGIIIKETKDVNIIDIEMKDNVAVGGIEQASLSELIDIIINSEYVPGKGAAIYFQDFDFDNELNAFSGSAEGGIADNVGDPPKQCDIYGFLCDKYESKTPTLVSSGESLGELTAVPARTSSHTIIDYMTSDQTMKFQWENDGTYGETTDTTKAEGTTGLIYLDTDYVKLNSSKFWRLQFYPTSNNNSQGRTVNLSDFGGKSAYLQVNVVKEGEGFWFYELHNIGDGQYFAVGVDEQRRLIAREPATGDRIESTLILPQTAVTVRIAYGAGGTLVVSVNETEYIRTSYNTGGKVHVKGPELYTLGRVDSDSDVEFLYWYSPIWGEIITNPLVPSN